LILCFRNQSRIHGNQLVAQLLSAGADMNIKNKKGKSAADYAPENLRSLLKEGYKNTIVHESMKSSLLHVLLKQVHSLRAGSREIEATFNIHKGSTNNEPSPFGATNSNTLNSYIKVGAELQRTKELVGRDVLIPCDDVRAYITTCLF
jgi:ankyrin repeat protein